MGGRGRPGGIAGVDGLLEFIVRCLSAETGLNGPPGKAWIGHSSNDPIWSTLAHVRASRRL